MSALILDAGALVAVDRNDRMMMARLRVAQRSGANLRTTGVVVAEVWRDASGRQSNLARLLHAVDIRPVDDLLGRQAGILLGKAGVANTADATVVAVAGTGDRIITSDPHDIERLVAAAERSILVIAC